MRFSGILLSAFFLCVSGLPSVSFAETPKIRVAVMVSDDHYDADKLLPPLMERLAEENDWEIILLHGKGTANFPSIKELEKADVFVVYVRRLALPREQLDVVREFVASGRGVVGIRTASHAFHSGSGTIPEGADNWVRFDQDVLGCSYHGHGANELGCDVRNVPEKKDSEILKDVTPEIWHSESSLYYLDPLAADVTVYQTCSSSQKKDMPLTWTRCDGSTRIAYTALGHQKDFEVDAFRHLLRNLVHWAANHPEGAMCTSPGQRPG